MSKIRGKQGSVYVKGTHAGALTSIEGVIQNWSFDQGSDAEDTSVLSQYANLQTTNEVTNVNFSGSLDGFFIAAEADKLEIGTKVYLKLVLSAGEAAFNDSVSAEVAAGVSSFVLGSGATAPVAGQKLQFAGHNKVYTVDTYTVGTLTVTLTEALEAEVTAAEVVRFSGTGRFYYGAFNVTGNSQSGEQAGFVKMNISFSNANLVFKNNDALDPDDLANSQYAIGNAQLYA